MNDRRKSKHFQLDTEAFVVMRNHQPIAVLRNESEINALVDEDVEDLIQTDGLTKIEVLTQYDYTYEAVDILKKKPSQNPHPVTKISSTKTGYIHSKEDKIITLPTQTCPYQTYHWEVVPENMIDSPLTKSLGEYLQAGMGCVEAFLKKFVDAVPGPGEKYPMDRDATYLLQYESVDNDVIIQYRNENPELLWSGVTIYYRTFRYVTPPGSSPEVCMYFHAKHGAPIEHNILRMLPNARFIL